MGFIEDQGPKTLISLTFMAYLYFNKECFYGMCTTRIHFNRYNLRNHKNLKLTEVFPYYTQSFFGNRVRKHQSGQSINGKV